MVADSSSDYEGNQGAPPPPQYSEGPGRDERYYGAYGGPGSPEQPYAPRRSGMSLQTLAQQKGRLVSVIVLGIFLMLIGSLLLAVAISLVPPQPYDAEYDTNNDGQVDDVEDFTRDQRSYAGVQQGLRVGGHSFRLLGVALISMALIVGALLNKEFHHFVRLGMLLGAAYLLVNGFAVIATDLGLFLGVSSLLGGSSFP